MTETQHYNQNQTQFGVDEPILEQPRRDLKPPSGVPAEPPKKQPPWIFILAGVLGILIVLVLLFALQAPKNSQPSEETLGKTPIERELTPMEQRLEDAKALLRDANPTTQQLPFPPLDMELRIDADR